jgi:methyl-accepting chemotaxis protein
MPRDLVLEVLTKAEGKGLRDTADGLDRTAKSSDEMGKSFHEASREGGLLEGELGKVRQTGDKTTQTFKEATRESGLLEKEIQRVTAEIKRLGVEFDATGNTALLKDIGSNRSMLNRLTRLAKDLAPVAEEAGQVAGTAVASGIGDALKAVPFKPILIAGLVGAAVVAAPLVGTVIAGAITTAVGIGGIGLGILAASREPRVISAAKMAGARISEAFFGSGTALVAPIEHALDILASDFEQLHLGDTFAILAPEIADLAAGIGGLAKEFMPGFNQALKDGAPVIKELSEDLPKVGHALGDMLQQMAEGKGNVEGLKDTIYVLNTVMHDTGATLKWLSDNYHTFKGAVGLAWDGVEKLAFGMDTGKSSTEHLNEATGQLTYMIHRLGDTASDEGHEVTHWGETFTSAKKAVTDAATEIERSVKGISDAIDGVINDRLGIENTMIAWQRGLREVNGLVKENGTSLDITKEKGENNLEVISRQIGLAEELRQKTFDHTKDIGKANAAYDSMIAKLKAALIQAGFNKKEADRIVDSLAGIPKDLAVDLRIRTHVSGWLGDALASAAGLATAISNAAASAGKKKPAHRAAGGDVMAGVPYVVNEMGSETVTFPAQGTVHPAHLSPAGGGRTAPIIVTDSWLAMAFQAIRAEVARQGGDVQAVFGPRR